MSAAVAIQNPSHVRGNGRLLDPLAWLLRVRDFLSTIRRQRFPEFIQLAFLRLGTTKPMNDLNDVPAGDCSPI